MQQWSFNFSFLLHCLRVSHLVHVWDFRLELALHSSDWVTRVGSLRRDWVIKGDRGVCEPGSCLIWTNDFVDIDFPGAGTFMEDGLFMATFSSCLIPDRFYLLLVYYSRRVIWKVFRGTWLLCRAWKVKGLQLREVMVLVKKMENFAI